QQHVNDALLGRRELAPFDLGVPSGTAEEVVDDRKHQLRVEHYQAGAAERVDLDQVQARRYVQRVHVLAEFLHAHRVHGDLRGAPQQVVEADTEEPGEALVDHLERGHAPAHDAHRVDEV